MILYLCVSVCVCSVTELCIRIVWAIWVNMVFIYKVRLNAHSSAKLCSSTIYQSGYYYCEFISGTKRCAPNFWFARCAFAAFAFCIIRKQNRNKLSTSDTYKAHKHIQNTLYVYFVILLYSAAAYCTLICGLISQSVFGFIYVYIQL